LLEACPVWVVGMHLNIGNNTNSKSYDNVYGAVIVGHLKTMI